MYKSKTLFTPRSDTATAR